MKLISEFEAQLVAGGTEFLASDDFDGSGGQTVIIRRARMSIEEKTAFDDAQTYIANGISNCALGDLPACFIFLISTFPQARDETQPNLINWDMFGN